MSRYTRKYLGNQRKNPFDDFEIELHGALNRIDVEKDAYHVKPSDKIRNKAAFEIYANLLFGDLVKDSYDSSYNHIETIISQYDAIDSSVITINKATDKYKSMRLPDHILFGVQDAGMAPKRYNPGIQNLISPGSYIDTGPRTANEGIFYGFDTIIDMKSFRSIGMPMITKFESHLLPDESCSIKIQFDRLKDIDVGFSKGLKPVLGDTIYFLGNSEKNKQFNTETSINPEKACKFILCKELGDTLQAYFGKKYANETEHGYKEVCLFTNDNVLTLRSKLLHLQVVYNVSCGKNTKTFYHYPKMVEVAEGFQKIWKDAVLGQNNNVKEGVLSILTKKHYLMANGGVVRFKEGDAVFRILTKYTNLCDTMITDFLKIDPNSMKLETFRKEAFKYKLPRLFVEDVLNAVVLNNRALFDSEEQTIIMNAPKIGGGFEQDTLPPFEFEIPEEDDYTIDREYDDTFEETVQLKHSLYTVFKENYPEKSKDELCYIIDGISSMMYVYFGFIGSLSTNIEFAKFIFEKYEKGTFGSQSLSEFEREFLIWADDGSCAKEPETHRNKTYKKIRPTILVHGRRRKTRRRRLNLTPL